jgi:hypothetical protein
VSIKRISSIKTIKYPAALADVRFSIAIVKYLYTYHHCQYRNHIHLRTRHYQYRSDPDLMSEDSCRMHLHVYRHRYLDAPDRDWKQKHNCPTN